MVKAGPGAGRRLRAFAYTLVTTATVLLFAIAEWATEKFVSGYNRTASIAIELGIVLLLALIVRPVHHAVEESIDAAFYRRRRQAVAALEKVRHELTAYRDMNELLRRVLDAVEHHGEARACAVYLHRDLFRPEATSFQEAVAELGEDDPLVRAFRTSSKPAHPAQLESSAPGTHAFAMYAAGELVGFLAVESRHGAYDAEEIAALAGLAKDLAIAVAAIDPVIRLSDARVPNNLPADLPALIGREREIDEVRSLLAGNARIVTLTGSGGVGKTSVALAVARSELQRHEQGVWFVDFSSIRSEDVIDATLLSVLGAGGTRDGHERATVVEYLSARDTLLVLDNCEHVISSIASLCAQITATCPRVTVLTTSRELLHASGEHVYRLSALAAAAASELFATRARSVAPLFDPTLYRAEIEAICERLDGVPLAIELASARVRVLSPREILEKLDERFRLLTSGDRVLPRHQTLSATIAWSYDLLSDDERSLFVRLAAFRGGFSLRAATALAQDDGDEYHVLDLLTSLADKSLVTVVEGSLTRYRFLETIRAFATERAIEAQASAIAREQHARYFARAAAEAYHQFDTTLPHGWLERLAPDIDNIRAALEWAFEETGDRRMGAQMAADCGPVFLRMGLLAEGLRWCDEARRVRGCTDATAGRIEYVASMLHNNLIESEKALACAERAITHLLKSEDRRGLIRALSQVAQLYAKAHRFEEAEEPARLSIAMARELGEARILATVLRRCAFSLPPHAIVEARVLFEEALAVSRAANEDDETCFVLTWYSLREADAGCYDRAVQLATAGLACADGSARQYLQLNLGEWSILAGRPQAAYGPAREALHAALESSNPTMIALALAFSAPGHAAFDAKQAARLLGFARASLVERKWGGDDGDRLALESALRYVEQALGGEEMQPLLDAGAAMPLGDVIAMLEPLSTGSNPGLVTTGVTGDRSGALLR